MFNVKINNKEYKFNAPIKVLDLIDKKDLRYIACKVNNEIKELEYKIFEDSLIELLDLKNEEACKIYEASLRFIFAMSCQKLYPQLKIKFSYFVSKSILVTINGSEAFFTDDMLFSINEEMKRIVSQNLAFKRVVKSRKQAINFYQRKNYDDKIEIIKYRPEKTVHFYQCGDYMNYFYSLMVPSTSYLSSFNLIKHDLGIVLQYPRPEEGGKIPLFKEEKKYCESLLKSAKFGLKNKIDTISKINEIAKNNSQDFINICESEHLKMLEEVAKKISLNHDIRLIAISGPSSSGKTTFSNRLKLELKKHNITTINLSIDDYYLDREDIKPDENGEIDLENINTIDVNLFNEHISKLIAGEEVEIPHFDFSIKKRVKGKKIKVDSKSPIIIEGIHALNDLLTSSIDRLNKFKIYIAPHIQINLDDHNPISITEYRFLRRLVRDKKYRNSDAYRTFSMWKSVRKGEFKWIYFNQENVDYVFNSELNYELCVMKKHAVPLLKEIQKDSEYYVFANRLLKFLKYFVDLDDKMVPLDSLLREFIGGGLFSDIHIN